MISPSPRLSGPLVIAACLVAVAVPARLLARPEGAAAGSTPEHREYLATRAWLLKEGGRWSADNPAHSKNVEGSPQSFGYQYSAGWSDNVLRVKISGRVGDQEYLFWEGIYYWHPVRNRIVYVAQGTSGAVASGESVDLQGTLVFEVLTPDGRVELHRDEQLRRNDDEFESAGYAYGEAGWTLKQRLTWRRVKPPVPG